MFAASGKPAVASLLDGNRRSITFRPQLRSHHGPKAQRVEALKLVKDWSVRTVAVQTALIAFIGVGAAAGMRILANAANWTVACFAVSISFAAWVLSAIPYTVVRFDESLDIYHMNPSSAPILCRVPLWLMATLQHVFFATGIRSCICVICR